MGGKGPFMGSKYGFGVVLKMAQNIIKSWIR